MRLAVPAQAGLHVTKKTLVATERHRARVRKQRDDWVKHRLPAVPTRPERVVFIDETTVKINPTRQRGWSLRGAPLVMDAPFGSCGTQAVIAGLGLDALIALWVINGATDGETFAAYVKYVIDPELEPGTVVILAAHKNATAAKAIRKEASPNQVPAAKAITM